VAQSIAAVLNVKKRHDGYLEGAGIWCHGASGILRSWQMPPHITPIMPSGR
jgi:hypothetical protein